MFGQKTFGSSASGFGTFGATPNANPFGGATSAFGQPQQQQQQQQQTGFGTFGSSTTQQGTRFVDFCFWFNGIWC